MDLIGSEWTKYWFRKALCVVKYTLLRAQFGLMLFRFLHQSGPFVNLTTSRTKLSTASGPFVIYFDSEDANSTALWGFDTSAGILPQPVPEKWP
jgi:hypothetical protein